MTNGSRHGAINLCFSKAKPRVSGVASRFESEAAAQTGRSELQLPELFDVLVESVEVTALQRGCERWEP